MARTLLVLMGTDAIMDDVGVVDPVPPEVMSMEMLEMDNGMKNVPRIVMSAETQNLDPRLEQLDLSTPENVEEFELSTPEDGWREDG
jgi:hypothetical protein